MPVRILSEEDKNLLCTTYLKGMTVTELSDYFDVSRRTVRRVLVERGWESFQRNLPEYCPDRINDFPPLIWGTKHPIVHNTHRPWYVRLGELLGIRPWDGISTNEEGALLQISVCFICPYSTPWVVCKKSWTTQTRDYPLPTRTSWTPCCTHTTTHYLK